jgi:protein CpxP
MSTGNETTQPGVRPSRRRRWLWIGGGLVAGLLALVAVMPRAWAYRGLAGRGFGGHGSFGARMLEDPAAAKQHVGMAVEWALRGVDATESQKQEARAITDRLVDELGPAVVKHHELREALARELARPEIDRAAIEALRRQGITLADETSKTLVGGMTDLAQVLTPDQRAELVAFAHRFHGEAPAH